MEANPILEMYIAAKSGDLEAFKSIIERHNLDINTRIPMADIYNGPEHYINPYTMMNIGYVACREGNIQILEYYIEKNGIVNLNYLFGVSAQFGNLNCMHTILNAGYTPNNIDILSCIQRACTSGWNDIVTFLLTKHPEVVNICIGCYKDKFDCSCGYGHCILELYLRCFFPLSIDIIQTFLDFGAVPTDVGIDNCIARCSVDILKRLCINGHVPTFSAQGFPNLFLLKSVIARKMDILEFLMFSTDYNYSDEDIKYAIITSLSIKDKRYFKLFVNVGISNDILKYLEKHFKKYIDFMAYLLSREENYRKYLLFFYDFFKD